MNVLRVLILVLVMPVDIVMQIIAKRELKNGSLYDATSLLLCGKLKEGDRIKVRGVETLKA